MAKVEGAVTKASTFLKRPLSTPGGDFKRHGPNVFHGEARRWESHNQRRHVLGRLGTGRTKSAKSFNFNVFAKKFTAHNESSIHVVIFIARHVSILTIPWMQLPHSGNLSVYFGSQFHLQTLIIYKLGCNQDYYTFTSVLRTNIVLCGEFP